MKKMYIKILFVSVFIIPALLPGQLKQDRKVNMSQALTRPNFQSIFSVLGLNPDNFSMSHSYTLSFTAFGGNSFNQGLYLNTMQYKFSELLSLHLQIGLQHQPFGNKVGNYQLQNQMFISSAGLEYKPTDNLKFQVEFSQTPGLYYYNRPFMDPITRNRAWFDSKDETKQE